MQQLILVVHVFVAFLLIALVLLQHGKGADIGASFGSGSSNTVFGSQGATPFLMKVTYALAAVFFISSLSMAYLVAREQRQATVLNLLPVAPAPVVPRQLGVAQTPVPAPLPVPAEPVTKK